jgi:hypothetical protein
MRVGVWIFDNGLLLFHETLKLVKNEKIRRLNFLLFFSTIRVRVSVVRVRVSAMDSEYG